MTQPASVPLPQDYAGENLVCIVGSPRSGTTWLQKMLAAHPRVATGQESDLFDMYLGPQLRNWNTWKHPTGRGILGLACYLTQEQFLDCLRGYTRALLGNMFGGLPAGSLFIEKTPSHALFLPEILELLPKARIIHLLRDPRDVVVSMLNASRGWGSDWAPATPHAAATMWREHVQAVRGAAGVISPQAFLELRYEDLLRETEDGLSQVLAFLGLEAGAEQVRQYVADNTVERMLADGGSKLPYRGEARKRLGQGHAEEPEGFVGRGRAGEWRQDLNQEQLDEIARALGPALQDFGYA